MKRPQPIYKYTRIWDKLIDSVKESYLWFSSPDFLNDPFDLNYRFSDSFMSHVLNQSGNDLKRDLKAKLEELGKPYNDNYINQITKEILGNKSYIEDTMKLLRTTIDYSVCCFTEKFDNTLMWSHYADNHKGVCLIYDLEKDLKYWEKLFPVEYQNEYPILDNVDELPQKALLRKSPAWHYEEEWRILNMTTGKNEIKKESLIGIIFGCNVKKEEREMMIKVCEEFAIPNFKFYQMEKHKSEYKLIKKACC